MHLINLLAFWVAIRLVEFRSVASNMSAGEAFSLSPFLDLYAPFSPNQSQCYAESLYFKTSAKKLSPWALRMLDASSKVPSSLLVGNTVDLGNFEECLAVRSDGAIASNNVIGKYCLVKATLNRTAKEVTLGDLTREWSWSVCMPASCSARDLIQHLENSFIKHEFNADHVQGIYCRSSLDDTGLPLASWIFIMFVLLLIMLIAVATYTEHKLVKASQFVKSVVLPFSLVKNGQILLSSEASGQIQSMHGIRVISMLAVVTYHRSVCATAEYNVNRLLVPEMLNLNVVGALIQSGGSLAVDAFFLMSGLLLARGFMTERKAQVQFSYLNHIVHRFLRVTPPYLFVILLHVTVFYELGSGPVWEDVIGGQKRNCMANGWTNILYFNNYVNDEMQCMYHTWYLGADMQMYILAPAFLFVLHKNRQVGMTLLVVMGLVSCVLSFRAIHNKEYQWIPIERNDELGTEYLTDFYMRTEIRVQPFVIGLIFGYFLEHFKKDKVVLRKSTQRIGWIISGIVLITVPYLRVIGYLCGWGAVSYSVFESLHRAIFGAAIGWVIFACDQGYGGGVDRFLSHRWFQILSRLSFCFYLIQFMPIYYDQGTMRTVEYFSYFSMFQKLLMDIVVGIIGSAILSLALEYPFIHLNKLLFKKKKKEEDDILTMEEKKTETRVIYLKDNNGYCIFT